MHAGGRIAGTAQVIHHSVLLRWQRARSCLSAPELRSCEERRTSAHSQAGSALGVYLSASKLAHLLRAQAQTSTCIQAGSADQRCCDERPGAAEAAGAAAVLAAVWRRVALLLLLSVRKRTLFVKQSYTLGAQARLGPHHDMVKRPPVAFIKVAARSHTIVLRVRAIIAHARCTNLPGAAKENLLSDATASLRRASRHRRSPDNNLQAAPSVCQTISCPAAVRRAPGSPLCGPSICRPITGHGPTYPTPGTTYVT